MKQSLSILLVATILLFAVSAVSAMAQSGVVLVPEISLLLFPNKDCNGDKDGTAYLDMCGNCVGGNTGDSSCYEEVTSLTGKVWLDRNLGASQVATSSDDPLAYGDLYQWGRLTDGHESRTSQPTSTDPSSISSIDVPGHGDFITTNTDPWDWRVPQNDNLWQGVSGTNNPCPAGFRLPTAAEWETERLSWAPNNAAGAFASPLKIVVSGYRQSAGGVGSLGNVGYYWSSTVTGTLARILTVSGSNASGMSSSNYRAYGQTVRCLKN